MVLPTHHLGAQEKVSKYTNSRHRGLHSLQGSASYTGIILQQSVGNFKCDSHGTFGTPESPTLPPAGITHIQQTSTVCGIPLFLNCGISLFWNCIKSKSGRVDANTIQQSHTQPATQTPYSAHRHWAGTKQVNLSAPSCSTQSLKRSTPPHPSSESYPLCPSTLQKAGTSRGCPGPASKPTETNHI